MLTITVAQDGSGDFASIAEAVLAVPYEEEALVQVGPGLYREKLVCEKRCITLRGAGADRTRLGRRRKAAPQGRPPYPHLPQLHRLFQRRDALRGGHDHRE